MLCNKLIYYSRPLIMNITKILLLHQKLNTIIMSSCGESYYLNQLYSLYKQINVIVGFYTFH